MSWLIHWRFEYGSLLTNNNHQFGSRWNQIDDYFDILYLSKAKAYSLLAFCTAIAGVVLFVCRRKSSNIIFGQTGLLLVMLFKWTTKSTKYDFVVLIIIVPEEELIEVWWVVWWSAFSSFYSTNFTEKKQEKSLKSTPYVNARKKKRHQPHT